jgi:hypothetical protein
MKTLAGVKKDSAQPRAKTGELTVGNAMLHIM